MNYNEFMRALEELGKQMTPEEKDLCEVYFEKGVFVLEGVSGVHLDRVSDIIIK